MNEDKPPPFADLLTGMTWLALSVAIMVGAWQMDRLTHLQASIYTVPGLIPGVLGAALALMSAILIARSLRAGALAEARWPEFRFADHWRLLAALVLCLGFAIGMVGHGPPFWLSAAIFVATFVFIFQYEERRLAGTLTRGALFAVVYGFIAGYTIHHLFQNIFLVRLP